jgi:hypothetical protein
MSRNHARRLDAREPHHLDPNWYTFRRFSAWETAERRSESSPEPSLRRMLPESVDVYIQQRIKFGRRH